jgi:hypothetical protein
MGKPEWDNRLSMRAVNALDRAGMTPELVVMTTDVDLLKHVDRLGAVSLASVREAYPYRGPVNAPSDIAARLRALVDAMPHGSSITFTRESLVALLGLAMPEGE